MARELIVKIKCDICQNSLDEDQTFTGEITFGGTVFGIDLCEDDYIKMTNGLTPKPRQLTEANKTRQYQSPAEAKEKTLPCPACGHMVKNELGLKFHIKRMHPGSD